MKTEYQGILLNTLEVYDWANANIIEIYFKYFK